MYYVGVGVAWPPARPIKLNANESHLPLRTILKCERFLNANASHLTAFKGRPQ